MNRVDPRLDLARTKEAQACRAYREGYFHYGDKLSREADRLRMEAGVWS